MSLSNTVSKTISMYTISLPVIMYATTLSCKVPSFVIASLMRTTRPMIVNIVKRLEVLRHNCLTIPLTYFFQFSWLELGTGRTTAGGGWILGQVYSFFGSNKQHNCKDFLLTVGHTEADLWGIDSD